MTTDRWQQQVRVGFQVFSRDGSEEFGAVREVRPRGRRELLINVENGGDHSIPLDAVVDVHDEKVIVDLERLSEALRSEVSRAHDAEVIGL
jgi:hypothetical protein